MRRLGMAMTCVVVICAALGGERAVRGAGETAPELAAALQRKYDGIKDFAADFSHT